MDRRRISDAKASALVRAGYKAAEGDKDVEEALSETFISDIRIGVKYEGGLGHLYYQQPGG